MTSLKGDDEPAGVGTTRTAGQKEGQKGGKGGA